MNGIGEGIAFSGLCAVTAWLEISGIECSLLWLVVVFWAFFSDWGQKKL